MNFIKDGVNLGLSKVDTQFGQETNISIPKEFKFLDQVFDTLPDNSFLCKSVAGVGGTTLAIKNDEHYIIAGSSVELIKNKVAQHENLIGVYGKKSVADIREDIEVHKVGYGKIKIITTYDSLPKVVEALGCDVKDYKLLVDELQVLLKASDEFKPVVVNKLFDCVGLFKSVCFMTATPTPRKYFPDEVAKLDYYRINWEGSQKMKIKKSKVLGDVNTKVTAIALHHLDNGGTPLFFYNSLKGIIPCVKNLMKARGLTHKDIKIICADNERNTTFLKEQLGDEWTPERPLYKCKDEGGNEYLDPKNKPIQFITKYAFEGLDFKVDDAVTYIISDVKNKHKHHTRIDVSTDLQQIAGRVRTQNPLSKREAVFLWNDYVEGVDLTEEEYEAFVRSELELAKDMEERYTLEKMQNMYINLSSSPYFVEIDGKYKTNPYSICGMCIAYAALNADYVQVMVDGVATQQIEDKMSLFSETEGFVLPSLKVKDKQKLEKKQNFKELSEEYYSLFCMLEHSENKDEIQQQMDAIKVMDKEFGEIVNTIGIEEIKTTSFHKTKSKAKYNKLVGVSKASSSKSKAYRNLRVKEGMFYTYSSLRENIQNCYDACGVKAKAKATDIKLVYNVKRTTRQGVEGFVIGSRI